MSETEKMHKEKPDLTDKPKKKVLTVIIIILSAIVIISVCIILFFPIAHYDPIDETDPALTYAVAYVAVDWQFDNAGFGVYPIPWHKLVTGEMPVERNVELTYRKITNLELLWDTYELPKTGMTYLQKKDEHYHAHPELYRAVIL